MGTPTARARATCTRDEAATGADAGHPALGRGQRRDLPEGDAAVVRRHPLVPVGAEAGVAERGDGPFRQHAVLEAAAAQHHPRLAARRRATATIIVGQRVVDARRHHADGPRRRRRPRAARRSSAPSRRRSDGTCHVGTRAESCRGRRPASNGIASALAPDRPRLRAAIAACPSKRVTVSQAHERRDGVEQASRAASSPAHSARAVSACTITARSPGRERLRHARSTWRPPAPSSRTAVRAPNAAARAPRAPRPAAGTGGGRRPARRHHPPTRRNSPPHTVPSWPSPVPSHATPSTGPLSSFSAMQDATWAQWCCTCRTGNPVAWAKRGGGIVGVAVGHHHLGVDLQQVLPGWRPPRETRPATAGDRGRRCAG